MPKVITTAAHNDLINLNNWIRDNIYKTFNDCCDDDITIYRKVSKCVAKLHKIYMTNNVITTTEISDTVESCIHSSWICRDSQDSGFLENIKLAYDIAYCVSLDMSCETRPTPITAIETFLRSTIHPLLTDIERTTDLTYSKVHQN